MWKAFLKNMDTGDVRLWQLCWAASNCYLHRYTTIRVRAFLLLRQNWPTYLPSQQTHTCSLFPEKEGRGSKAQRCIVTDVWEVWECSLCICQAEGNWNGDQRYQALFGSILNLWMRRAFQVAQMVKNLPAMQETPVWPWGHEDPWRRE